MFRFVPSTIRGQLIAGTVLLQCLLVAIFAGSIYRQQRTQVRARTEQRLLYQAQVLTETAAQELADQHMMTLQSIMTVLPGSPTIRAARITDLHGTPLAYGDREGPSSYVPLTALENLHLHAPYRTQIFTAADGTPEILAPIRIDNSPVALAWIYPDLRVDRRDLHQLLTSAVLFGLLAILAYAIISILLARSITRPLQGLLRGIQLLIRNPEVKGVFPIRTRSQNEAGVLTHAFNSMVAALNEQRAGLNDTLALLDSMLANAPIGFAFFDRNLRYVRVNQFLAEMNEISISRHVGRPLAEVLSVQEAAAMMPIIQQVFATGEPVHDMEMSIDFPSNPELQRTRLMSFYPVTTGSELVQWVGTVVMDTTQSKKSEEALRRTEKLAATGRLAASIAHEINNPLEAVTNLLYLLHDQPSLDAEAVHFAEMAQQELARVSQITQQTLRFYRQATQPTLSNLCEVLDSVLALYLGRLHSAQITVVRRFHENADLLCFGGEMRQLFANLVGNAMDAMSEGGRITVSVRPSRNWSDPFGDEAPTRGVRVVIADTGSGMTDEIRRRIFEPFFTTKEATGTGLGLWVSAEIIEKHQGTIRVRSRVARVAAAGSPQANVASTSTVFMIFFPQDGVLHSSIAETAADGEMASDKA